ncbi:MAG: hypothetical protein HN390_15140 [Anaerolineae bacterium]|jgi:hypothetical protein|nr:hypothetical protein [Anaerolineae bacterium]MBT7188818.1 hypothetical protein [Anaerolineae bacterium]MBT7989351.1 hypothetical protein [Anaerolineae bacterium]
MEKPTKKFNGNLDIEGNDIILKTDKGNITLISYPPQTAISLEAMKLDAVNAFSEYIGNPVTISGMKQDDQIYDAKIIRSYKSHEPEKYGKEYWNNRIQKAHIRFKARRLPGYNKQFEVDVRQMITINDSIIYEDLKKHSLLVRDLEICDEDIYRIYHHSRVKRINPYRYEYDEKIFGCEFFMYPYELRTLHKGDCDDWGIELASYLITAGIPEWRIRCVVGNTFGGGGHLTVYVLDDQLSNWYHLNSTTAWPSVIKKGYGKLSDFPKANDSNDKIGIKDVWFSFNNLYAWHAFETHTSEENMHRVPWMNSFLIRPILG